MKTQPSSQIGRLAAVACFLFVVAGLGLVSAPVWALTWTPDLRLSIPPDSVGVTPAIASGQDGHVHVVWVGAPGDGWLLSYKRWDGAAWSLTQGLAFSQYRLERPSIAVDVRGYVHVVFDAQMTEEQDGVYYMRWDGISWSQVYRISDDETGGICPSIATDTNGYVHVAWYGSEIYYKRWDGESWTLTMQLNDQHYYVSNSPCLTADVNGNLHAAWITWLGTSQPRQLYYKRWNGWSWTADSLLVDTPWAEAPAITADPVGNVHLTWIDGRIQFDPQIMYKRWDGATWSGDESLYYGMSRMFQHPTITASDDGNVHVAWTQYPFGGGDSQLLYKLWNGVASETERTLVSGSFSLNGAAMATDTYGNVHLVWQDGRHYNTSIYYKMRKHCLDGDEYEECRWYTPDPLFYERYSANADTLSQLPGVPVFYDSTRVTINRGPNDRFYISGEQYALADWICDDKLYIDGADAGLGFAGVADSALTLCQPIEDVLMSVPPRDVTDFIPEGDHCVTFKLADTQRAILGNTRIYLVWQDVSGVADGDARVSPVLSVSPNPAQRSALFELSVPATGQYALDIYSVDGRLVRSYPAVRLTAGEQHRWTWDGRDQLGETAGQGMYFGAARSSAGQTVRKLLIVR